MNFHDHSGDYVIVGAGGLAREIWGWIKTSRDNGAHKRLVAFVDRVPAEGAQYNGIPILDEQHPDLGPMHYLLAIGDPRLRKVISQALDARGWQALSYVHESVVQGVQVSLGRGVIVCPRASLSSDCVLHEHVLVNGGCGIAHDVVVGAYSVLLGAVSLNGNVQVGECVTIGAGALVHPGRRIGDHAVIGMGSAVFAHVKPSVTVVGNPARPFSI